MSPHYRRALAGLVYYPNMGAKRSSTGRLGPDHYRLLSAISEGLVTRAPANGPARNYLFDGELIGYNQIQSLANLDVIDTTMAGAPQINAYGERLLREWLGQGNGE